MIETWDMLLKLFRIVTIISSLQLNVGKTQIWIIRPVSRIRIQVILQSLSPDFLDSSFKDYIKYLDILLEPAAIKQQFGETIRGYLDIVIFLRGIDADFIITVALCQILTNSKLSYIASFV